MSCSSVWFSKLQQVIHSCMYDYWSHSYAHSIINYLLYKNEMIFNCITTGCNAAIICMYSTLQIFMHFVYGSVLTGTSVIPLHFAKRNAKVQKIMIAKYGANDCNRHKNDEIAYAYLHR